MAASVCKSQSSAQGCRQLQRLVQRTSVVALDDGHPPLDPLPRCDHHRSPAFGGGSQRFTHEPGAFPKIGKPLGREINQGRKGFESIHFHGDCSELFAVAPDGVVESSFINVREHIQVEVDGRTGPVEPDIGLASKRASRNAVRPRQATARGRAEPRRFPASIHGNTSRQESNPLLADFSLPDQLLLHCRGSYRLQTQTVLAYSVKFCRANGPGLSGEHQHR